MNEADAKSTPTENGHIGQYRLCWRTDYFTVQHWCKEAGKMVPTMFKNPLIAELYAWREKHKREQAVMTRDGVMIEARSEAEAIFNLPTKQERRKVLG